ncbi:MAG: hypothetical protein H0U76_12525 [Ktedonobacteraceae bacterium]|nr:hypothetical protein [Ktedonobacteraceae bacterium]
MIGGLLGGLKPNTYIDRYALSPNEGLYRSATNGLVGGLVGWSIIGVIFSLLLKLQEGLFFKLQEGLFFGLPFGMIIGLIAGLHAVIQHFLLRFWLWRSGSFPFEAGTFLEDARARHLLQRVGGSYRFVHRLLLDYFADLDT